jgi:hypothetical protein
VEQVDILMHLNGVLITVQDTVPIIVLDIVQDIVVLVVMDMALDLDMVLDLVTGMEVPEDFLEYVQR